MSDRQPHAEHPLAIGERRIHARIPVTPQAFVKFGDNNYGFVFNISECGLVFAPTETLTLAVGATAKMRFQLPDSKEWVETGGEVAWIAESKKEAGVRFVEMAEDTRNKIRDWISQEPSRSPSPPVRDDTLLNSIFADPALFLVESKSARAKPTVQLRPVVAEEPPQDASASHIPERRSQPRRRVLSLEYLDLGDSNGGIILNLSEGGMYVQAVASLSADDISDLRFRIPDSTFQVETSGQVAWVGESRKDAGIRFVNLPEEARLKIREWVTAENPERIGTVTSGPQPIPGTRKNERLVEMPQNNPLKTSANIDDAVVSRVSRKQTEPAGKLSTAEVAPRLAPKPAAVPATAAKIHTTAENRRPLIAQLLASGTVVGTTDNLASSAVAQRHSWRRLAAAIILVVFISFAAGWIAVPAGRKQFMDMFASQPTNSSDPADSAASSSPTTNASADSPTDATRITESSEPAAQPVTTPPSVAATENRATSASEIRPPEKQALAPVKPLPSASIPSGGSDASNHSPLQPPPSAPAARTNSAAVPVPDASRESRNTSQPVAPPASLASSTAAPENKPRRPQSAQPPALTASSNAPGPAAKNAPPVNVPVPTVPASSATLSASNASPPPARADSAPLPSAEKPSALAEIVKGTVSVSASPFPSLHIPPELKSQISRQGAALQIGQLISRLEPVYPEDAERQRIEGVVKLHIIIGRDGTVQDIDQMSGPPLLVAAAANAIRQWRYHPTSLGGEPVEAGEAITVTFRLQSAHLN